MRTATCIESLCCPGYNCTGWFSRQMYCSCYVGLFWRKRFNHLLFEDLAHGVDCHDLSLAASLIQTTALAFHFVTESLLVCITSDGLSVCEAPFWKASCYNPSRSMDPMDCVIASHNVYNISTCLKWPTRICITYHLKLYNYVDHQPQ